MFRRARNLIIVALAAATLIVSLSACDTQRLGWEPIDLNKAGQPVKRSSCVVHYKVNVSRVMSDRGRRTLGYDWVTALHQEIQNTTKVSGLRWVFDGYTKATWDGAGGTRSGRAWARTKGVLIEVRDENALWSGWSQPNGPDHRRNPDAYTGGVMWFDLSKLPRTRDYHGPEWAVETARNTIAHELGHQSGLGDLYDATMLYGPEQRPKVWPAEIRQNNKMGASVQPWGRGDLAGFAALRPAGCR